MSYTLQITDGTTTVDLSKQSGNTYAWIKEYAPKRGNGRIITETVQATFKDSSVANTLATIRSLERLLENAARWDASERGARVYVKRDFDGTDYRSELVRDPTSGLAGKVEYSNQALAEGLIDGRFEVTVTYTRADGWEADSETELTTPTTGNLITNGGNVDIDDALLTGVAEASCRLEITNTYATGTLGQVYVGLNAFKGSDMPAGLFEGESATGMTEVADAGSSGGKYGKYQLSGTSQQLAGRWAITATELDKYAGHVFHALLRAPVSNSGLYAQLRVCYTGSTTVLAETPSEVLMDANGLQDLGVIELPPGLAGDTDLYTVDLCLYVRGADDAWLYCDCVRLLGADGFRHYTPIAATLGMAQNAKLEDDSSLGRHWVEGISSTQRSVHYLAAGHPFKLFPGRDHRLTVLGMNTSGGCEMARTFTVKLYGRPVFPTL